jgi:hypothetical protein
VRRSVFALMLVRAPGTITDGGNASGEQLCCDIHQEWLFNLVCYVTQDRSGGCDSESAARHDSRFSGHGVDREAFDSFETYLRGLVGGEPIQQGWQAVWQLPAETALSATMGKELKQRGLNFAGPTIVYYVMRAVAMVTDHTADNFRYGEVAAMG